MATNEWRLSSLFCCKLSLATGEDSRRRDKKLGGVIVPSVSEEVKVALFSGWRWLDFGDEVGDS